VYYQTWYSVTAVGLHLCNYVSWTHWQALTGHNIPVSSLQDGHL